MTPAARWVRNLVEKWFGRFHEGPQPPERIANMVFVFALEHPHATRGDWIRFAIEHAGEAYRSAYVRGVEYAERDPALQRQDVPPDLIASQVDPDWAWGPAVDLEQVKMGEEVYDEPPPEYALMAEDVERIREAGRRRRRDG